VPARRRRDRSLRVRRGGAHHDGCAPLLSLGVGRVRKCSAAPGVAYAMADRRASSPPGRLATGFTPRYGTPKLWSSSSRDESRLSSLTSETSPGLISFAVLNLAFSYPAQELCYRPVSFSSERR